MEGVDARPALAPGALLRRLDKKSLKAPVPSSRPGRPLVERRASGGGWGGRMLMCPRYHLGLLVVDGTTGPFAQADAMPGWGIVGCGVGGSGVVGQWPVGHPPRGSSRRPLGVGPALPLSEQLRRHKALRGLGMASEHILATRPFWLEMPLYILAQI